MKIFKWFVVVLFYSVNAFSQENVIKHTVVKGDNIYQIAKKYNVKPNVVLDANPEANGTLKLDMVLLIPNGEITIVASETKNLATPITHKVAKKETLYGISKHYNVSVASLKSANPIIDKEGLKAEQEIIIPSTNNEVVNTSSLLNNKINTETKEVQKQIQKESKVVAKPNLDPKVEQKPELTQIVQSENEFNYYVREVKQKETKYGIAKEYGISVAELENQNQAIKNSLQVGQQLKIKTLKKVETNDVVAIAEQNKVADNVIINDSLKIEYSTNEELVEQLIVNASENIGTRYRLGGTTKDGFDCSGLMVTTFGNYNVQLPRTSIEQSQFGDQVNFDEAQKGDLIFFKTSRRSRINHVGMVVEADGEEIKFIHASVHGGVIISSTKEKYYKNKFAQVNRVLK